MSIYPSADTRIVSGYDAAIEGIISELIAEGDDWGWAVFQNGDKENGIYGALLVAENEITWFSFVPDSGEVEPFGIALIHHMEVDYSNALVRVYLRR